MKAGLGRHTFLSEAKADKRNLQVDKGEFGKWRQYECEFQDETVSIDLRVWRSTGLEYLSTMVESLDWIPGLGPWH